MLVFLFNQWKKWKPQNALYSTFRLHWHCQESQSFIFCSVSRIPPSLGFLDYFTFPIPCFPQPPPAFSFSDLFIPSLLKVPISSFMIPLKTSHKWVDIKISYSRFPQNVLSLCLKQHLQSFLDCMSLWVTFTCKTPKGLPQNHVQSWWARLCPSLPSRKHI